jgi:hypothetical protein
MTKKTVFFLIALLTITIICPAAMAEVDVGKIVALRGKATIQRDAKSLDAQVKMGILSRDTIKTGADGRVKLLFIDDSVLTLADNTKLVVKEFVYSKTKEGKSIFNLIDGKMRTVVGKTRFEVQTPTAVAAARGTVIYFDVGLVNNQAYTKIVCLEGTVVVTSIIPTITGEVVLTPGTMVIIKEGEPLPESFKAPPGALPGGGGGRQGGQDLLPHDDLKDPTVPTAPPLQQQPVQPKNVNIIITPPPRSP